MVDYFAQKRIASELLAKASPAAFERMKEDARAQKQSLREIAFRRAGNLLRNYVLYKPNGCVEEY